MAATNYRIYEFSELNERNEVTWPASTATNVAAAGSLILQPSTKAIVVTADDNGRIEIGGLLAAASQSIPVLGLAPNQFQVNQLAQRATVLCQ